MFNKKFKGSIFHCYVRVPECNQKPIFYLWLGMMSLQAILYSWFLFMKKWDIGTWLSRSFALGSNQIKRFLSYNWARFLWILSFNWAEQSTPKRCELPWFSLKWTERLMLFLHQSPPPPQKKRWCLWPHCWPMSWDSARTKMMWV